MSNWTWRVTPIPRGEKCAGQCKVALVYGVLVDYQGSIWHVECLLNRLTGPAVETTPPTDCGSGLPHWGLAP